MDKTATICAALDPVPPGMRRFRIRGLLGANKQPLSVRHVLARTQADAEAAYVADLGLDGAAEIKFVVGITPA